MGGGGRIKRGATPLYAALTRTLLQLRLCSETGVLLSETLLALTRYVAMCKMCIPSISRHKTTQIQDSLLINISVWDDCHHDEYCFCGL